MEKKRLRSKFSPEELAKEWRQAVVFLKKMEGMARISQGTLLLTPDQYEAYNAVIRHAQEASAHLQAMFEEVGKVGNPTILH